MLGIGKLKSGGGQAATDLTEGPIARGITGFAVPIFLGQLLQQLYNVADAWVVGNFADNNAFAAVASSTIFCMFCSTVSMSDWPL